MTTRQRKRLSPYASFVRTLARRRTEKGARKLLIQTGSGLGGVFAALLTPILELSRYLHLRDEQQNRPTKVEITKGLKALIKRGDESDEEQFFDLGSDGAQPPASQSRRRHRRPRHYNEDEEMPLQQPSPPLQAENRGQKRKANEFYSSWEEGAKRQLRHEDEPVTSSSKIVNRQRRRQPPVSLRREESQIPADIQQEEPFQPAPQPSIPIHPQINRKRKAQHALNDAREVKKSLIGLEELRTPSLQHEASLRFQRKRTNKPRVTLPQHSSSSALVTRRNPPRDLLAEAASAPLPDDDDGDDFELPQQPATSAQAQPLPPIPPLPSKAKKRKSNKAEEENERKRIKIGSRKRDLLAEAAAAPLPVDDDLQLSQQPETSAQVHPPGPPLPSKTKKRKSNKTEEDTERKRTRVGSRKRLSSPTVTKNEPKRQKNPVSEALSEEQRHQFAEDQHLFTIPNSQLTNEQKRRRLQFVFNRNPSKYGVHGDTVLNNAGNPITDSSVAQALDYIIERRAGRIPQFRQPPGTKLIRERINRDLILRTWTAPPRNETGERQGARRIDTSVSNEGGQAEVDDSVESRNRYSNQKPTSQTTKMEKSIENVLDRLYNDPKSPAAFAGVDRLWLEAKKELGNKIRKSDVRYYLEGHRTYTLMRPRRINFPRARTTSAGFMTDCQVDLADFQALSRHNSGNRYLMVVIDVLSKRIFVTPLRTKKSDDMVEGFKRVFSTMPMKPHRIFSDKGTEFRNQQLKKLFDEEEVEKYESTHSEKKAALAERAIRQIKNRVYRYFAQTKTLNWVDVIYKIVNGINNSPSRVHGMRPIDVNFKNSQSVWEKMFGEDQHRALFGRHRKRTKFVPGQTVRMSIAKGQFEKGYIPNYGDEILEIEAVKRHKKPMQYKLRDAKGEKFKGFFYPEELAPVRRDTETTYRIERVFRKRKMPDGTMEVLVKFEELKNSNGPTVSKPPLQFPVTNQTTVSPVKQITSAKTNYTKTSSSLINEEKLKEIGPPPKQRTEKSTVETVSSPQQPPPAVPTHSNVTEKKATSPPRVIATEIIGPPPKQRNEKSVNTKHGQAQLVNEIIPENTKKTTITTTTTTTTITEPPKDTSDDFIRQIEEPIERNNAEKLLSVLFGNEEWKKINLRIVRQIIEGVELQYHPNFERFKAVFTHPRIEFISFSPQLGYVLGFENSQHVRNNEISKYGSDLRGGFASFAVYAKGLTENMIVGNSLSSLLRVVSVSGALPGEYTEKIYDSPLYARVLPKEVSEIEIELRTMTDGRLVPFSYGTVLVVLIFKKVINF
ncbi:hypothetical protein niasHS_005221 [Heterodera schachtii]|uniref:Integrase catalytic domain-containing protein n=1 Tax=Heterodera schachtii TaxID=97005 RepID=A0ABD2JV77_HETSC